MPLSTVDISHAVAAARRFRTRVTVKGGGHNPAGLAVADGESLPPVARKRKMGEGRREEEEGEGEGGGEVEGECGGGELKV